MYGENAKMVKMDLSEIREMEYSFKIFDDWSKSMKASIKKDVESFSSGGDARGGEATRRYAEACDEAIINLLFGLKWALIDLKKLQDGNQA